MKFELDEQDKIEIRLMILCEFRRLKEWSNSEINDQINKLQARVLGF